jgi:hypothetical protein
VSACGITSPLKAKGPGICARALEDYFFFLAFAFFAFLFFAMVFPLGWEAPEGTSASNAAIRN